MTRGKEFTIIFGSKEIRYTLLYQERKSLGITVHPDKTVTVKAPLEAPLERIEALLRKRAPWILKQQRYFLAFEPLTPARKYINEESHLYLGRKYRLRILDAAADSVKINGGFLEVRTRNRAKTKDVLWNWYKEKATIKFKEIAAPWLEQFKKYGVEPSHILIKQMEMRWGSCTPNAKIILNTELVKAPKGCIEYVIVHELCHLVHHNHSSAFFELQTKEMPDWMKWKERLEKVLA